MRYDDFRRSDDIDDRRDDSGGGGWRRRVWPADGRRRARHRHHHRARPGRLCLRHRSAHPDRRRRNPDRRQPGADLPDRSQVGAGQDRRAEGRSRQHDRRHSRRDRRPLERDIPGQRAEYTGPRIVLFRNATNGGRCGMAQSAMGPFYCPPDKQIFLDTSFFREVETRFKGCSGSACKFTTAYIIAHEAGHHIQNLLGILPRVQRLQQQAGSKAEANALQVKVELQADCFPASGSTAKRRSAGIRRARRYRSGVADGDRDRRRHAAAAVDGQGGAGQFHARLRGAAKAMVHDRLPAGYGAGLQHVCARRVVVSGKCRHGRAMSRPSTFIVEDEDARDNRA